MSNMMNKAQGFGLSLITKIAGSEVLDQLKLRKFVEKSLYQGSKTGFKVLNKTQKAFKPQAIDKQRLPNQVNKNLFDLSLTEEQQMTVDAMSQFAEEVLYALAHEADHNTQFPEQLWQHLVDLGLNDYALPEALGGVAAEQNIVSNILIAESLAKGDFSLTAGLLSTFSVINAITRWGSTQVQSMYLPVFAEDTDITATCAMAIGTCEAIKAYCIKYANERTAFGEPISHRQSVAFMISDMAIEIDAMRMLVLNAASLAEAGKPFHREAYLARLLCAEKSMKMGTDGVQILGGHGFTKEHPVERWYRDLRATAILHSGLHA